jgi:hypothetical protein
VFKLSAQEFMPFEIAKQIRNSKMTSGPTLTGKEPHSATDRILTLITQREKLWKQT